MSQDVAVLEAYTPVQLRMNKLEACFFKVNIVAKSGPLLLLVNDHLTSPDKEDYKVYWSLTEKHPSLDQSDGAFSSFDWIMKIPFTSSPKTPCIYVGVYTQNSIATRLACSFGANTGASLSNIFIADKPAETQETDSDESDGDPNIPLDVKASDLGDLGISKNKVLSKNDKLKIFHYQ